MKPTRFTPALGFAAAVLFAACAGPGTGTNDLLLSPGSRAKAIAPQHGIVSALRHVYGQVNFDGTTFTEVAHANCGHRGLGGMTPYAAPTSGPLTLSASVTLPPRCVPSPAPSTPPQIYIYAIALSHGHPARSGGHFGGVIVAGPANVTDNPWVFVPASPGLTMAGGVKYDFVIASQWTRPTP